MSIRSGLYARISRDSEELGLGVARQIADCEEHATKIGWLIAERYVDNDVSATKAKRRPEYERMMTDARCGRIAAIVVWDVDRLTRTPRELEDIIDLAQQLGLQLASVGGPIDLASPQGQLTARIKGSVARHETDQLARRMRRKYLERAQSGAPHVFPPYGYQVERDLDANGRVLRTRHVLQEEQSQVVLRMITGVLAGRSLRSIAQELNAEQRWTPRGHPWASQTVRRVVMRPVYAGLKTLHGEIVGEGTWPALISRSTHEQVVQILRDPTRRTQRGSARVHLLTGLLKCGRCGHSMVRAPGHVKPKTGGRGPEAYSCPGCFRVQRLKAQVDEVVMGALFARLRQPDALEALVAPDADARTAVLSEIAALEARLQVAAEQYAVETITAQQMATISRTLQAKLVERRSALSVLMPARDLAAIVGPDVETRWEGTPLDVRRMIIDLLMEIVILPSGPGTRFAPEQVQISWK